MCTVIWINWIVQHFAFLSGMLRDMKFSIDNEAFISTWNRIGLEFSPSPKNVHNLDSPPPRRKNSQLARSSSLSRPHDHIQLDAPQSVGLLWTSDQPNAETSTWQHTTVTTDRYHASGGIRNRNPSKKEVRDSRLRRCGHWDRHQIQSHTDIHIPSISNINVTYRPMFFSFT